MNKEYIKNLLISDSEFDIETGLIELQRNPDFEFYEQVKKLTYYPDPHIAILARQVLVQLEQLSKEEGKEDKINVSSNREEEVKFLQEVIEGKNQVTLDELKKYLSSNDKHVLATAVKAVMKVGGKKAISMVVPFLNDSDPRVVANTIESFKFLPQLPDTVKEKLLMKLKDENHRIATTALEVLFIFSKTSKEKQELLELLFDYLMGNYKPSWKIAAIKVLENVKSLKVDKLLENLAISLKDEEVKKAIDEVLSKRQEKRKKLLKVKTFEDKAKEVEKKKEKEKKVAKKIKKAPVIAKQSTKKLLEAKKNIEEENKKEKKDIGKIALIITLIASILAIGTALVIYYPKIRQKIKLRDYNYRIKYYISLLKQAIDTENWSTAMNIVNKLELEVRPEDKEKVKKLKALLYKEKARYVRVKGNYEDAIRLFLKAYKQYPEDSIRDEIVWALSEASDIQLIKEFSKQLLKVLKPADWVSILDFCTDEEKKFIFNNIIKKKKGLYAKVKKLLKEG